MIRVLRERWRAHPLAWIHRAEARAIAAELAEAGLPARLDRLDLDSADEWRGEQLLLRLSDPIMLQATQALTNASIAYAGPSPGALGRCYDKYQATRIVAARGIDCPKTWLASEAVECSFPFILKPRRGSDSIGVRPLPRGAVPRRLRDDLHIVQPLLRGSELTVGVLGRRIGRPLLIHLREGTPYSFARKYIFLPPRTPLADDGLAAKVQGEAEKIARALGVDWAARVDFILERASGRLRFLECDAAPLLGVRSAFAASLAAGGVNRSEQLRLLVEPACRS